MELCTRITNQLMLKNIEEGTGKNIVSSPLSINVLLNMVAGGLNGPALERMLGYLRSENLDEIYKKSLKMVAVEAGGGSSNNIEDAPILSMVNGAWVDRLFPLKPYYKESYLNGIFDCESKTVNFATQANEVEKEINSWADTASRGLIKDLIAPGSLDPDTALVLANGLYFNGIWDHSHKFNAACTENRDFYLLNGDTVSVPFMTSAKKYHYGSYDGFKVLKIPYQSGQSDNKFSMYFFLPDEQNGLRNLLTKFNSDSGFLQQKYFNLREVRLKEFWIPKFKFSLGFDVTWIMEGMGVPMSPVFQNPKDLSEMMHIPEGVPFLTPKIIQKAYIEVDEKGTEATAITYLTLMAGSCGWSPPEVLPSFVADHPFIFMIKEDTSGLVFFSGAVVNPILEDYFFVPRK